MLIPRTCTTLDDRAILARRRADKLRRWRNAHPAVQAWKKKALQFYAKSEHPLKWAELYALGRALPEFKAFQRFDAFEFTPRNRAAQSDIRLFRGPIIIQSRDIPEMLIEQDRMAAIKERQLKNLDWDGLIADPVDFAKQEADDKIPPDPAEDLGDYTEVDPNSHITINNATDVTLNGLTRNEDAKLYIDHGANYWSGDWDWKFNVYGDTDADTQNAISMPVTLTNSLDNPKAIDVAGGSWQGWWVYDSASVHRMCLYECASGGLYGDIYSAPINSRIWINYKRDDSVGSYGELTGLCYSDAYSTLVDTLTLSLHAKIDWRYVHWVVSWHDNGGDASYDQIDDLDFQGGGPSPGGDIAILRRRRT